VNRTSRGRAIIAAAAIGALALGVAACGSSSSSSSSTDTTAAVGAGGKIALLLPETKTARYETQDKPLFTAKVKELCPDCTVIYSNADQDAAKQQQQAEAALTNGAKVLVLDPVDAASAGAIAAQAKAKGVPVISYDRLISNSDLALYISYDNEKVGRLQATSLVNKMTADGNGSGTIVMINGAPTDGNAKLFKAGAHSVFDKSTIKIGAEYDTPDWSPDKAQSEMDQAITKLGKTGFQGVYAANDGTAGGAIASMKGAGIDPSTRPTTGQDAELAAIQRIVAGTQYMTIYKAPNPEASSAAEAAVASVKATTPPATTGTTNNGTMDVPSIIFDPVVVTVKNINETVIKDGTWSAAQICTAPYKAACDKAGIK